jgi:hypothetical protein
MTVETKPARISGKWIIVRGMVSLTDTQLGAHGRG